MNEYKLQQLEKQRDEIKDLLSLFNRAAFRPYDGNNGGDPTAALNGIYETRVSLQTSGAVFIRNKNAASFFSNLQDQLLELENNVREKYPQVMDVAIRWREKPINTVERITSIRQELGKAYEEAAIFIRAEAFKVYNSPEKARTILEEFDKEIDQLVNEEDTTTPKTGILFLAADPKDASRLRLGEEFGEINEQIKRSEHRDLFKLELPQLSLQPKEISEALLNLQPKIVHFSGHGMSDGELCFENEKGQIQLVQPEALADLFKEFANQVNCVVLNACNSQPQAEAIGKHIKYVVGMKRAISDKAAIAFTTGFYQTLGAGSSIEKAYRLGCNQIKFLPGTPEPLPPDMGRGMGTGSQELPGTHESLTPVLIIEGQLQQ